MIRMQSRGEWIKFKSEANFSKSAPVVPHFGAGIDLPVVDLS